MHQPNTVHPPNGFTQLAPYPTENALAYNEEYNISIFSSQQFPDFKTKKLTQFAPSNIVINQPK
jgi:hypothetical protein